MGNGLSLRRHQATRSSSNQAVRSDSVIPSSSNQAVRSGTVIPSSSNQSVRSDSVTFSGPLQVDNHVIRVRAIRVEFSNKYRHLFPTGIPSLKKLSEVKMALDSTGLPEINLIIGVDFSDHNRPTGRNTFRGRSLHTEQAFGPQDSFELTLKTIGQALDILTQPEVKINCFGFGDSTFTNQGVFSFNESLRPCHGFTEVIKKYRELSNLVCMTERLSLAPVIRTACSKVRESGGQFHVFVILLSGAATFSFENVATIAALNEASRLPLSIVVVGIGDEFQRVTDDLETFFLSHRSSNHFRFLDFNSIISAYGPKQSELAALGLAMFMDVPVHFQHCILNNMMVQNVGSPSVNEPGPSGEEPPMREEVVLEQASTDNSLVEDTIPRNNDVAFDHNCPVCLDNRKNWAFRCGHLVCEDCKGQLSLCPICRGTTQNGMKVFL